MKLALLLAMFLVLFEEATSAAQFETRDVDQLVAQLNGELPDTREKAAKSLSQTVIPAKISPAIKKRLEVETNFHVKLALNYALACQGERAALEPINSRSQDHASSRFMDQ